jgi:hypothetical protein
MVEGRGGHMRGEMKRVTPPKSRPASHAASVFPDPADSITKTSRPECAAAAARSWKSLGLCPGTSNCGEGRHQWTVGAGGRTHAPYGRPQGPGGRTSASLHIRACSSASGSSSASSSSSASATTINFSSVSSWVSSPWS